MLAPLVPWAMLGFTPSMTDRDLYERSQILSAIISVVLHDLRNRLHSATLLVEAMGADKASLEGLRTRLRAQLTRLNATITDASDMAKDIPIESRIAKVTLRRVLDDVRERGELPNQRLVVHSKPELAAAEVKIDPELVVAAVTVLTERLTQASREAGAKKPEIELVASIVEPTSPEIRLTLGFAGPAPSADAGQAAPPEIPPTDFDLALARTLTEGAGASLRLERPETGGGSVFVLRLPKA